MKPIFTALILIALLVSPALAENYTLNAFLKHDGDIEGVAFSADGRTLASMGTDRVLHYWNPYTEKQQPQGEISAIDRWSIDALVVPEEPHILPVNTFDTIRQAVSFPGVEDPNGLLATGSSDKTIWLQGFPTLRPLFRIQEHGEVTAVALSPDGRILASAGEFAGIRLWDLSTISPVHGTIELKSTLAASTGRVEGLDFSPDGQTLAVATGKSDGEAIHLWDLSTEQLTETLIAVGVPIRKVAFSPDGQIIAAGASDYFNGNGRNVLLWRRGPLSPARVPHSVELDGPEIVTALNKDFTFTVTVKNTYGSVLENVVVMLNNLGAPTDWEHSHPTDGWTNSDGEAEFTLRFYDAGQHDIEVSVLDRATREATLTQQFIDRVEVPKPHSVTPEVTTLKPIVMPPNAKVDFYKDTFIVMSEDGQALEGFQVTVSTAGVSDTDWTDSEGKARCALELSAGTYDVDVTVRDFRGKNVWLEQSFPNRVTLIESQGCSAVIPGLDLLKTAKGIGEAAQDSDYSTKIQIRNPSEAENTGSLNPDLVWQPYHTAATDLGISVFTVEFLNGSSTDKFDVKQFVKHWSDGTNIGFQFVESGPSDVRIYFEGGEGHNSFLGTEYLLKTSKRVANALLEKLALNVQEFFGFLGLGSSWIWPSDDGHNTNAVTMNLGTNYSSRTIMHEFGHVFGFNHSHLVPSFPYEWDEAATYTHYTAKNSTWDDGTVEQNILNKVDLPDTESFDPDSIMQYYVPADLLKDKPEGIRETYTLSELDKEIVVNHYGKRNENQPSPQSDYVFIRGKVHIYILDRDTFSSNEECDVEKDVSIFVRAQEDEYKSSRLAQAECDNEVRVEVDIESRGIVNESTSYDSSKKGLEMKASVRIYVGDYYYTLEDQDELEFILPLDYAFDQDSKERIWHKFFLPKVVNTGAGANEEAVVTLELGLDHPKESDVIFPHRKLSAVQVKNGKVVEGAAPSLIPVQTALLSNYPNPFNPETWIPYQLAEPAEVTLNIYSVDGKLVRRLALGHQAAGFYQSRSRAAYWDGRNALGERVASGIYFYTLTAGSFATTRKMLIMK